MFHHRELAQRKRPWDRCWCHCHLHPTDQATKLSPTFLGPSWFPCRYYGQSLVCDFPLAGVRCLCGFPHHALEPLVHDPSFFSSMELQELSQICVLQKEKKNTLIDKALFTKAKKIKELWNCWVHYFAYKMKENPSMTFLSKRLSSEAFCLKGLKEKSFYYLVTQNRRTC